MQKPQPHIQLDESIHAKYALLPGDPARLDRISPFRKMYRNRNSTGNTAASQGNIKGYASLPYLPVSAALLPALPWKSFPASASRP